MTAQSLNLAQAYLIQIERKFSLAKLKTAGSFPNSGRGEFYESCQDLAGSVGRDRRHFVVQRFGAGNDQLFLRWAWSAEGLDDHRRDQQRPYDWDLFRRGGKPDTL